MKILLDLQTLQSDSRDRGIGQYTRGFAGALLADQSREWHGLFNLEMPFSSPSPAFDLAQELGRARSHHFASLTPIRGLDPANVARDYTSGVLREGFISGRHFDLVHVNSPFEGYGDDTVVSGGTFKQTPTSATVYDLIPLQQPDIFLPNPAIKDWYFRRIQYLRNADLILAISHYTAKIIEEELKIPASRITHIGADVSRSFQTIDITDQEEEELRSHYHISKPYIIHTGILEERKNVSHLLRAFARLSPELIDSHQIALCGDTTPPQHDHMLALARTLRLPPDSIVFPGFVPEKDLVKLYNLAALAVMPSLQEGFGLPLLEAMRCGCAVLGSNRTSLPEVVGNADYLFDPCREQDLASKLQLLLTNKEALQRAKSHASEQQKRFSWENSARIAVQAFDETITAHRRRVVGTGVRAISVSCHPRDIKDSATPLASSLDFAEVISALHLEAEDADEPLILLGSKNLDLTSTHRRILSVAPAVLVSNTLEMPCLAAEEIYERGGYSALLPGASRLMDGGTALLPDIPSLLGCVAPAGEGLVSAFTAVNKKGLYPSVELAGEALLRESSVPWAARVLRKCHLDQLDFDGRQKLASALSENHEAENHSRLFVDVTELAKHDAGSGIQRVVRNITRELIIQPGRYRVEPVYRIGATYRYAREFTGRMMGSPLAMQDEEVCFGSGDVFLGLDLDITITSRAAETLFRHRRRGLMVVFIVYDVLPISHPEWFHEGTSLAFERWFSLVSGCADRLICISQATADAVHKQLPAQARLPKIGSFYLGTAFAIADGAPIAARATLNQPVKNELYLMVGTLEPRKGHAQVLDAFELLWASDLPLTLGFAGKAGWKTEELSARILNHPEFGKRLQWSRSPSDEALSSLYQDANAILVASKGEGFGLPLVEAATFERPLIVRDLKVFREIAGPHAFYFTGETGEDLAWAIRNWREAPRRPNSAGIRLATWGESAGELLQQINSVP